QRRRDRGRGAGKEASGVRTPLVLKTRTAARPHTLCVSQQRPSCRSRPIRGRGADPASGPAWLPATIFGHLRNHRLRGRGEADRTGSSGRSPAKGGRANRINRPGFSFDAAGRMLAGTFGTVAAQRGFTWDPSGQMLSFSEGGSLVTTYQYDAFGRRVRALPASSAPSTFYLYGSGDGSHPIAEYTSPNWQNNVLAGGAVIATVDASGNVRYLAADMLGTTRQTELNLTSASDATRFFPYGEEQNAVSSEYLWTGQMR